MWFHRQLHFHPLGWRRAGNQNLTFRAKNSYSYYHQFCTHQINYTFQVLTSSSNVSNGLFKKISYLRSVLKCRRIYGYHSRTTITYVLTKLRAPVMYWSPPATSPMGCKKKSYLRSVLKCRQIYWYHPRTTITFVLTKLTAPVTYWFPPATLPMGCLKKIVFKVSIEMLTTILKATLPNWVVLLKIGLLVQCFRAAKYRIESHVYSVLSFLYILLNHTYNIDESFHLLTVASVTSCLKTETIRIHVSNL